MATMAKQLLALAAVAAGLGGPTVLPHDRRYYMVTGGKN
jgi:hypothetical protein